MKASSLAQNLCKKYQIVYASVRNNYSPKKWWLVVAIYQVEKQQGKYPPLANNTEANNCF